MFVMEYFNVCMEGSLCSDDDFDETLSLGEGDLNPLEVSLLGLFRAKLVILKKDRSVSGLIGYVFDTKLLDVVSSWL